MPETDEIRELTEIAEEMAMGLNNRHILAYNLSLEDFEDVIDRNTVMNSIYIMSAVLGVGLMLLVMKFKTKGIYASVLQIGYVSTLLILIRMVDFIVNLEGIAAIVICIAINYIALYMVLDYMKKNEVNVNIAMKETIKKLVMLLIPVYIIAIVLTFATLSNLASFGMALVWGAIVFYLYNLVFSRTLLNV